MKFKLTKNKIISISAIALVLTLAFWYGGSAPGLQGIEEKSPSTPVVAKADRSEVDLIKKETDTKIGLESKIEEDEEVDLETEEDDDKDEEIEEIEEIEDIEIVVEAKEETKDELKPETRLIPEPKKDKYNTDPIPAGRPAPKEPEEQKVTDTSLKCTLLVRCDTILNNMDWLDPVKVELVPEDGVIYAKKEVTFYEGESVFNVIRREMKQEKIHMEFTNTPMYNSAYIEGINNLYEFDCGELSGWMYKVNDWFPNYGASRYNLENGDNIEWLYTCDLGEDIGGHNSARQ